MSNNYIGRSPSIGGLEGRLLQAVSHVRGDVVTGAAFIPVDNTIPQITEGNEFFAVTITPKQIGSRLRVRCIAFGSVDVATNTFVGALFRAGQNDALACGWSPILNAVNGLVNFSIETEVITASLAPITFSARFGSSASNVRLNASGAAQFFGGAFGSFLKVEEFAQ